MKVTDQLYEGGAYVLHTFSLIWVMTLLFTIALGAIISTNQAETSLTALDLSYWISLKGGVRPYVDANA